MRVHVRLLVHVSVCMRACLHCAGDVHVPRRGRAWTNVAAPSAPGTGLTPMPHLHRGLGSPPCHICTVTGLTPMPHLHRDWATVSAGWDTVQCCQAIPPLEVRLRAVARVGGAVGPDENEEKVSARGWHGAGPSRSSAPVPTLVGLDLCSLPAARLGFSLCPSRAHSLMHARVYLPIHLSHLSI